MKAFKSLLFIACLTLAFSSCSVFKPKYGCPATGKNVGAEKLLSDPQASRKAKKFRS